MSDQVIVIVAGMHRAGTSAVMRVLGELGVGHGPADSLMGASEANPFGHFEQLPVVELNDELLDAAGSHWVAPLDRSEALGALATGKYGDRARSLVDSLFSGESVPWAIKDPRFCITMAFWRQIFSRVPTVVMPVRHPLEVASSLEIRDQLPLEHGLNLWQAYYELLIADSSGLPLHCVNYDDVVSDPVGVSGKLAEALRLPAPTDRIKASASMIDSSVRHHEAESASKLPSRVEHLWHSLLARTPDEIRETSPRRPDTSYFELFSGALSVERRERMRLRDELASAEVQLLDADRAAAEAQGVITEALQDRDKARHHFLTASAARQRSVEERLAIEREFTIVREQLDQARVWIQERDDELQAIYESLGGRALRAMWNSRISARETRERLRSRRFTGENLPALGQRVAASPTPVNMTRPENPLVSIVVPVHGHLEHTARCLQSLESHVSQASFEVVVINDASPDSTREWLAACSGLEVVDLIANVGYLRATNSGLERSQGEFVLLLNNDTTISPGSIDALVDILQSDASIGAVGAKLVYPNGVLQEAGSIIWSDGTGWNYGRGGDPFDYRYDFVREVDYCSAACLLVRRAPFAELGWFDERYAPAYYEDTDLCFGLRSKGFRVMYQPAAVVTHHEGVSHGTDENAGVKAHQAANRRTFTEKWEEDLRDQWPAGTSPRLASWRGEFERILVFDHEVPAPDQDSGSVRMDAVLSILTSMGYRVTFFPHNRTHRGHYNRRLELRGTEIGHGWEDWAELVTDYGPDLAAVFASRPSVAAEVLPLVTNRIPDVPTVYDMVDFHGLRVQRELDLAGSEQNKHAKVMTELERALVRMADITVAITEDEAALVRNLEPDATIITVPNIHDSPASTASFEDRNGVVFIGSYRHPPNRDAIRWLMDDIMPVVWASNPTVTLHLVGSDLPADIVDPSIKQARVHGWLEDLDGLYNEVRLSVAPLRYGAGMKGKIGDSLIRGVPVITTPVGAEGFGTVTESLVVAESASEIATKILELHERKSYWTKLANSGRLLTEEAFGKQAAVIALEKLVREVNLLKGSSER